ncbi:MAG: T9SS type A sorting domain-containing protein, partial [Chitinophagaceae bacterium]
NGGDVLTFEASSQTSVGEDANPTDNFIILNQTVVNSFDPNDKTCLEGTSITSDMIGKYVHYMIRFENTGTFAAQNIVVKDMIDATKFDVSSLIALNGSHPYVTRITGNKVEFIFEGINLPFDDANNDGYVVFKIKTLPTLALGDSFSNTASIYFDYNHPIVTEPAVTTFAELGREDFVFNNYFTLYPNPTNGILNITSKQAIELQSISIYNVLGQMVVVVPNAKGVSNVDVSSLSVGNYFIKIISDKGISNAKFIKQ